MRSCFQLHPHPPRKDFVADLLKNFFEGVSNGHIVIGHQDSVLHTSSKAKPPAARALSERVASACEPRRWATLTFPPNNAQQALDEEDGPALRTRRGMPDVRSRRVWLTTAGPCVFDTKVLLANFVPSHWLRRFTHVFAIPRRARAPGVEQFVPPLVVLVSFRQSLEADSSGGIPLQAEWCSSCLGRRVTTNPISDGQQ